MRKMIVVIVGLLSFNQFLISKTQVGVEISRKDIEYALHAVETESSDSTELSQLNELCSIIPELASFVKIRLAKSIDIDNLSRNSAIEAIYEYCRDNHSQDYILKMEILCSLAGIAQTPEQCIIYLDEADSILSVQAKNTKKQEINRWEILVRCYRAKYLPFGEDIFGQFAFNKLVAHLSSESESDDFCQLELYKAFLSLANQYHTEDQSDHYFQLASQLANRLFPNSINEQLAIKCLYVSSLLPVDYIRTGNIIKEIISDSEHANGVNNVYATNAREASAIRLSLMANPRKACTEMELSLENIMQRFSQNSFEVFFFKSLLSQYYAMANRNEQAIKLGDELIDAVKAQIVSKQQQFILLSNLGLTYQALDYDIGHIEDVLKMMADIANQYPNRSYIGSATQYGLASTFIHMGRITQGLLDLEKAKKKAPELTSIKSIKDEATHCLLFSFERLYLQNFIKNIDWEEAIAHGGLMLDISAKLSDNVLSSQTHLEMSRLYQAANKLDQAEHHINAALHYAPPYLPGLRTVLINEKAKVIADKEDFHTSDMLLDSLLNSELIARDKILRAMTLETMGSIIFKQILLGKRSPSSNSEIAQLLVQSLNLYNQTGDLASQSRLLSSLATIAFNEGDIIKAQEFLNKAIKRYEQQNLAGTADCILLVLQFADMSFNYGNVQTGSYYLMNVALPCIDNFSKMTGQDSKTMAAILMRGMTSMFNFFTALAQSGTLMPDSILSQIEEKAKNIEDNYSELFYQNESPLYADYLGSQSRYRSIVRHDYELALEYALKRDNVRKHFNQPTDTEDFRITCLMQLGLYDEAKVLYEDIHDKRRYDEMRGTPAIEKLFLGEQVYTMVKNFDKAIDLAHQRFDLIKNDVVEKFSLLNTTQRESFMRAGGYNPLDLNYFVAHQTNAKTTTIAYDGALFYKGILLKASDRIRNAILSSGDSLTRADFKKIKNLKQQLQSIYFEDLDSIAFMNKLLRLHYEIDEIDSHLMEQSLEYRYFVDDGHNIPTWKDVQKKLNKQEAAIEFIFYVGSAKLTYPFDI